MLRTFTDFHQIIPGLFAEGIVIERQGIQADDGVHRCTNLVAHAGHERKIRLMGLFRLLKAGTQITFMSKVIPDLPVHVTERHHNLMAFRVRRPGTDHAKLLIALLPASQAEITADQVPLLLQTVPDILRIGETQKFRAIRLRDTPVCVFRDPLPVRPSVFRPERSLCLLIRAVTQKCVIVQINAEYAQIAGR